MPTAPWLTVLEAFDGMRRFLDAYWRAGKAEYDDLARLLSWVEPDRSGQPLDMAQWSDWLAALDAIEGERKHLYRTFREAYPARPWHVVGEEIVGPDEAYAAMRIFLEAYRERGHTEGKDVGPLIKALVDDGLRPLWTESLLSACSPRH